MLLPKGIVSVGFVGSHRSVNLGLSKEANKWFRCRDQDLYEGGCGCHLRRK